jgi:hypothetical protein
MFIKNLMNYFFSGWLWKSKLHRCLAGGTWYKYMTIASSGNKIYFWSIIHPMHLNKINVLILIKIEKYN